VGTEKLNDRATDVEFLSRVIHFKTEISWCLCKWEADTIPTDAIPSEIHVDRHVVTLYIYIHQGVTIKCVMKYDFALGELYLVH